MIGGHPSIIEIHKQIGLLARNRVTVLIQGVSGTGKELAARILHQAGVPGQPFVGVNCSAVVSTLLESEFFGHEKGAFTGADRLKIGKLEHAAGGTVFLDEIGDMPLPRCRLCYGDPARVSWSFCRTIKFIRST